MKEKTILNTIILIFKYTIIAVIGATIVVLMIPSSPRIHDVNVADHSTLPLTLFPFSQKDYDAIGSGPLSLNQTTSPLTIPDLSKELSFYGINSRPDAHCAEPSILLSFGTTSDIISAPSGSSLFIIYDKINSSGTYLFSKDNSATPLWITPTYNSGVLHIVTSMIDEAGDPISDNGSIASFTLHEMPLTHRTPWNVGLFRADSSILARQHARWVGKDLFLESHGGKEYSHTRDRERIDFGEGNDSYPLFVKAGDCFFWHENRWLACHNEMESHGQPLLSIESVDNHAIHMLLWNASGTEKTMLTLIKSSEMWTPHIIQQNIHFLGVQTKTQAIVEVAKKRMLVRKHDWLLHSETGWSTLETEESIDFYVMGKTAGELFIVGDITRKNGRQFLNGTLYSKSKSEKCDVELPLQTNLDLPGMVHELPNKTFSRKHELSPPNTSESQKENKPSTDDNEKNDIRRIPPLIKLPDSIRGALPQKELNNRASS